VVFGQLKIAADFLLDGYLTPADHPWPRFPISVPVAGKPYGKAAAGGWIQLDLSAGIGLGLLRVYQMTGEERYLAAARHIGDVLVDHCTLQLQADAADFGGKSHVAESVGAAVVCRFDGNQVRVIGRADPAGGLAEVVLDDVKQPVGIDCWTPGRSRHQQVLYYRNGLKNGPHELKIVAKGEKNPDSGGTRVSVDAVQWSAAVATADFGSGGGPTHPQRMILGYTGRTPYVDSSGKGWLPGTEFVVRSGPGTDPVARTWWTEPAPENVTGTADPGLYRHGVHAPEFWVNITVGPGVYSVGLRFAERRGLTDPTRRPLQVSINGQERIRQLDVAAQAGGLHRALDLQFDQIRPRNGIIEVRLAAPGGEAMLQALEVLPQEEK
jgi:hypothetical protein